jgi:hypothetical protein
MFTGRACSCGRKTRRAFTITLMMAPPPRAGYCIEPRSRDCFSAREDFLRCRDALELPLAIVCWIWGLAGVLALCTVGLDGFARPQSARTNQTQRLAGDAKSEEEVTFR